MKLVDITGQTFGRLTVLRRVESSNGRTMWLCRCACGKEVTVDGYCLKTGTTQSCRCYKLEQTSKAKTKDLTGMRFGRLTAIKIVGSIGHNKLWLCRCDCGKECEVLATRLLQGLNKSCGCLQDETRRSHLCDITGRRFGRLVAIRPTDKRVNSNIVWLCKCDCGKMHEATQYHLTKGITKSCGCLRREVTRATHLKWDTPEKQDLSERYDNMITRCYNKNDPHYRFYGARGIYVCDEWRNDRGAFIKWALENGFRSDLTLDRYPDKKGPYAPWNCRWASWQQQDENRTSNVMLTVDGVTDTITSWGRKIGSCHQTISNKKKKGKGVAEKFIADALKQKDIDAEVSQLVPPWGTIPQESVLPELQIPN